MVTRHGSPMHETFNQRVVGSIPTALTNYIAGIIGFYPPDMIRGLSGLGPRTPGGPTLPKLRVARERGRHVCLLPEDNCKRHDGWSPRQFRSLDPFCSRRCSKFLRRNTPGSGRRGQGTTASPQAGKSCLPRRPLGGPLQCLALAESPMEKLAAFFGRCLLYIYEQDN